MTEPEGCIGWALLPLRRYAEFGGRSRRTELVTFYLFASAILFVMTFAEMTTRSSEAAVLSWLLPAALLCPSLALATRRLHDTGRSGWWILLLVPGLALSFWPDPHAGATLDPEGKARLEGLAGLAGLADFALLVLLLWKDDPEPNRYGPNPRFDEPEPEAQDPA